MTTPQTTELWRFTGGEVVNDATGDTVALVITPKHRGDDEAELYARHERNGALLAAAPDLLAALDAVSDWLYLQHSFGALTEVGETHRREVDAAIAKARGQ